MAYIKEYIVMNDKVAWKHFETFRRKDLNKAIKLLKSIIKEGKYNVILRHIDLPAVYIADKKG